MVYLCVPEQHTWLFVPLLFAFFSRLWKFVPNQILVREPRLALANGFIWWMTNGVDRPVSWEASLGRSGPSLPIWRIF